MALCSDARAVLGVLAALERDPKTAGCRHVVGFLSRKVNLAEAAACRGVEELAGSGLVVRDPDSAGLPTSRGSWRLADVVAAEWELASRPSEEAPALSDLLGQLAAPHATFDE